MSGQREKEPGEEKEEGEQEEEKEEEEEEEEEAEKSSEGTYALSKCATLCALYATASSLCTKLLYTPSLVLSLCLSYSHISISYNVFFLSPSFPISTFFFSVFGSLSVAYSECYPTIVKWTIFDSSVLGLDEAATKFSSRKKTFLNGKAKAFQREEHYGYGISDDQMVNPIK